MVGTVEHDHGGLDVDGIAGAGARAHFPPVGENRAELGNLPVELVRGVSVDCDLAPVQVLLAVVEEAEGAFVVHVALQAGRLRGGKGAGMPPASRARIPMPGAARSCRSKHRLSGGRNPLTCQQPCRDCNVQDVESEGGKD